MATGPAARPVNAASRDWLQRLQKLAHSHDAMLIVDDIQVGCGRTGPFFSFEGMGVRPDIVCLSKSISGFGLPMALTLFRPELDQWKPGEHNGTFRGNNLAFVTATAALETYWQGEPLRQELGYKSASVARRLAELGRKHGGAPRGRGLIQGLAFEDPTIASSASCFGGPWATGSCSRADARLSSPRSRARALTRAYRRRDRVPS